ncbi:hypothetical protein CVT25_000988 [Psilocybe cyanescens]|uniref:Uncharacterized protein n=1 Tax=Psilocybe cyanescens TaxID=93625 RepID=A0A409XMB8_PSICY|nr:hypothetical protein CVT25_000988 [Psilocybe cyanescens]
MCKREVGVEGMGWGSRSRLYPEDEPGRPIVYTRYPTSANPSAPLALILSHRSELFWDDIIT